LTDKYKDALTKEDAIRLAVESVHSVVPKLQLEGMVVTHDKAIESLTHAELTTSKELTQRKKS